MPQWDIEAGAHVSIAGGIYKAPERAGGLGCRCFQVFLGSPRSWRLPLSAGAAAGRDAIGRFRAARLEWGLGTLAGHARYLVNPVSDDRAVRGKSLDMLVREARLAEAIDAELFVLHPGHAADAIVAARRLEEALDVAIRQTRRIALLLEHMAERPARLAGSFALLGGIVRASARCGLCLDLAHVAAAGYNLAESGELDRLLDDIDTTAGLDKVRLIHANDSRTPVGSFLDRHAHVAAGALGRRGFLNILAHPLLRGLPWIIETPKKPEGSDRRNLKRLHRLARDSAGEHAENAEDGQ